MESVYIPSSVEFLGSFAFDSNELLIESENVIIEKDYHDGAGIYGTIYCKTQACYNNIQSQQPLMNNYENASVILDPSKFN